jgi:hypothetical protein
VIPEETPSWLRNYRAIEADIARMEDVAAALDAEVRQNYMPHLSHIADDMRAVLPDPCDAFVELCTFLQTHWTSQQATSDLVHFFRDATGGLAVAAGTISRQYRGADAFASARVGDVERAFTGTATASPSSEAPNPPSGEASKAPSSEAGVGPAPDPEGP